MNIGMLLEMAADGMADRVAVGPRDGGTTYAGLLDGARRLAGLLQADGVERLVMVDANSSAVPLLLFGSALAGVPFVPINYRLADEPLRALVSRNAPGLAVVDPAVPARLGAIDGIRYVTMTELHQQMATPPASADGAAGDPALVDPGLLDPDGIAALIFTSGTTGDPKAAVLRHRHLTSYVLGTVEFMGAEPDHAALVSVPPYHVAGIATVLTSVYGGRRLLYLPQFEPDQWVDMAGAEGISHAMVVPTMLGRLLDVVESRKEALPGLVHLAYGGGRMPLPVVRRAMEGLLPHVGFVNAYGLTETSSTISILTPDDHRVSFASDDPAVQERLGSVGRPLPSLEIEIRGADGSVLPAGQRGEVYVRGEQVAGEYLGRAALTADGWFPTHDGGWLDEAGYLYVEGRMDDVIVRGAENISPGEVEDVLLSHPAVADVGVVGLPDDEWGETVGAAVVLAPGATLTAAALQDWARERLRSARTPTVVAFLDALPYNETGKLLRRVLRVELGA